MYNIVLLIGRLTDKEYYESLNYEEKQRYSLSLSERYLKAVERYNAEKSVTFRDENCSWQGQYYIVKCF